jgi:hypothetical protein
VKHVPTVAELVLQGLAEAVTVRTGAKQMTQVYKISAEGMALMKEAMRENALEAIANDKGTWTEPPHRTLPSSTSL